MQRKVATSLWQILQLRSWQTKAFGDVEMAKMASSLSFAVVVVGAEEQDRPKIQNLYLRRDRGVRVRRLKKNDEDQSKIRNLCLRSPY